MPVDICCPYVFVVEEVQSIRTLYCTPQNIVFACHNMPVTTDIAFPQKRLCCSNTKNDLRDRIWFLWEAANICNMLNLKGNSPHQSCPLDRVNNSHKHSHIGFKDTFLKNKIKSRRLTWLNGMWVCTFTHMQNAQRLYRSQTSIGVMPSVGEMNCGLLALPRVWCWYWTLRKVATLDASVHASANQVVARVRVRKWTRQWHRMWGRVCSDSFSSMIRPYFTRMWRKKQ